MYRRIHLCRGGGVPRGFASAVAMGCGAGMGCCKRTFGCGRTGFIDGNGFITPGDTELSRGGSGRLYGVERLLVGRVKKGFCPSGGNGTKFPLRFVAVKLWA
jgi:hypothetical protein